MRPDRAPRAGADLHVHTTHSDGVCSPGDVVRAAAGAGLAALAITDHDTLSAIAVARPEADRLAIELVSGIELTAEYEGREIHILGHYVRESDPALATAAHELRAARAVRIRALAAALEALGLHIDLPALERAFPRATLGRRHLAEWLTRTRQVANHRMAFALYLGDGGPAQVAKRRLPCAQAIALIRGAGGIAALAHPPYDFPPRALQALTDSGLRALEVDGPGVGDKLVRRRRAWAKRLGLVPIAGSDFHAPDRPGRWVGAITTPQEDLERLRAATAC